MNINFNPGINLKAASFAFKGIQKDRRITPTFSRKTTGDSFVKNCDTVLQASHAAALMELEAKSMKDKMDAKVGYIIELFNNSGVDGSGKTVAAIANSGTKNEKVMGEVLEDHMLRISKFKNGTISSINEYTGAGRKNEIIFYEGEPVLYLENVVQHPNERTTIARCLNIEYGEIASYKKGITDEQGTRTVNKSLKYSNGKPCVYGEGYECGRLDGSIKIAKELWLNSRSDKPAIYQENYTIADGKETVGNKVYL